MVGVDSRICGLLGTANCPVSSVLCCDLLLINDTVISWSLASVTTVHVTCHDGVMTPGRATVTCDH